MNRVILIGNLGADPESRTTPNGACVANLRVATSERRKDKDGGWTDHTEWHRVSVFGKTAENVGKFLHKGSKVGVEGRLTTRQYTDKDGVEKYSTEIVAENVEFLSGKGGGHSAAPQAGGSGGTPGDDDIPF